MQDYSLKWCWLNQQGGKPGHPTTVHCPDLINKHLFCKWLRYSNESMRSHSFSLLLQNIPIKKKKTNEWFEITLCHRQIPNLPCKHRWQQIYSPVKCISCSCTHNLLLSYIAKLGHEQPAGDLLSSGLQSQGHVLAKRQHFMLTWKHKIHIKQSKREPGCSSRAWSKCYVLRRLASVLQRYSGSA